MVKIIDTFVYYLLAKVTVNVCDSQVPPEFEQTASEHFLTIWPWFYLLKVTIKNLKI